MLGKARKQFFLKNPPKTIYVCSSRLNCAMNGEFENINQVPLLMRGLCRRKDLKVIQLLSG